MNSNCRSKQSPLAARCQLYGILLGFALASSLSSFAGPDDGLTCGNAFGNKWSESHKQWDRANGQAHLDVWANLNPYLRPLEDYELPATKELRRSVQKVALDQATEFAVSHHQPALQLHAQYDADRASPLLLHRPPGNILAWTLAKSDFAGLRAKLGNQGFWLLFRSYPFPKLGFPDVAIPHMSLMIGDRVYEVGRPLVKVDGTRVVSKLSPSGPLAISLDDYLYKVQLSELELQSNPGVFFGVWIAGVGPESLKDLAEYYEGRAEKFLRDKKFNYDVCPVTLDADNCLTYLNKPLFDVRYRPQKEIVGINGFFSTPGAMLSQFDHYLKPPFSNTSFKDDREQAPVFMFADDHWLEETEARFAGEAGTKALPQVEGLVSQFEGFFLRQIL